MRIILFLLISISSFGQFPLERYNVYEYGIIKQEWIVTDLTVICFFEANKINDYVDLKIKIPGENISYLDILIYTKTKHFKCHVHEINKRGFSIIRLFYRQKDLWKGIDSGIKFIWLKTDKKWHKIELNTNLNKLKNYGTVPNK